MIAELSRQQQAEQGWNQAVGMGFGAFAQPRNREAVSRMFNVAPIDATKLGETIMSTGSQQQGQDRANQIASLINDPKTGPAIAERLHMDWNALKTMNLTNPGAAAQIAQALGTPTPEMATLEQIQHMQGATGGGVVSAREIDDLRRLSLAGVAPDFAQQMVADQNTWRLKHGGQDPPWVNNKAAYENWKADTRERQESAADFGKTHGLNIGKVATFQHRIEALKTNPGMIQIMDNINAYKTLVKRAMAHPDEQLEDVANALPEWAGKWAGMSPEVKQAIGELRQLKAEDYSTAMHSIGQRFSTQEVSNVAKSVDQLFNLNLDKKDYQDQLDQLIEDTKNIRAQSHGAAQDFDTMDPELRTYVQPTFTKGGRRNVEDSGSEEWADKVKPPKEEIERAKAAIDKGAPRKAIEKLMRSKGYRPMGF